MEYLEPKDFDRLSNSLMDVFENRKKLTEIVERWKLNNRVFWSRGKIMNRTETCYIRLIVNLNIVSDPIWIDQFNSKEDLIKDQNRY